MVAGGGGFGDDVFVADEGDGVGIVGSGGWSEGWASLQDPKAIMRGPEDCDGAGSVPANVDGRRDDNVMAE
jgi:hypothetical protein